MKSDVEAPRLSNRELCEESPTRSQIKSQKLDGHVVEVAQRSDAVSDNILLPLINPMLLMTIFRMVWCAISHMNSIGSWWFFGKSTFRVLPMP